MTKKLLVVLLISMLLLPAIGGIAGAWQNCTFTPGYWKNHPGAWTGITLPLGWCSATGTHYDSYDQSELLAMMNQSSSNYLYALLQQLIAAKLNLKIMVESQYVPQEVTQAINAAQVLIGCNAIDENLVLYPQSEANGLTASEIVDILSDFNEGITGPGSCDD